MHITDVGKAAEHAHKLAQSLHVLSRIDGTEAKVGEALIRFSKTEAYWDNVVCDRTGLDRPKLQDALFEAFRRVIRDHITTLEAALTELGVTVSQVPA